MDTRFSRLRADHYSGPRDGHGADPALRRISYTDLRYHLDAADRLFDALHSLRDARSLRFDFPNPGELEEAAAASGASWWETSARTLPLLDPGFAAGWIYICIVSFREFSTSVLLATGESRVLSILLFTMFEQGQVTVVAAIGILMILTLLSIVAVFYKISGRVGIQT